MIEDREISARIIGAAISVHRELGPGFLESVYEEAMSIELNAVGISFERQRPVPISYRGKVVGEHRLDSWIENEVVVEFKAVQSLENIHFSIVRSYLKATDSQVGLLLNFAAMPLTIKRVGREESGRTSSAKLPTISRVNEMAF